MKPVDDKVVDSIQSKGRGSQCEPELVAHPDLPSDQSASLEESGLLQLVTTVRKLGNVLGDGNKTFIDKEKKVAKKLRYWE